jgi:leucyl aminopeptidase
LDIKVKSGNISAIKADALIVFVTSGHKRLSGTLADIDKALDGAVGKLLKQGEIKGKVNELTTVHTIGRLPASRVIIAGLGDKKSLDSAKVRQAAATACRLGKKQGLKHLSLADPAALTENISVAETGQALVEGAILGGYGFEKYHTRKDNPDKLDKITIVPGGRNRAGGLKKGLLTGRIMAEAIIVARDFVNEPSNNLTASDLADAAGRLAVECGISVEILEKAAIEELGMGCLLGVNRGSQEPPRFIILKYLGRDSDTVDLALVGKGITFDTGGISLKPSAGMDEMKSDMAGGASVIAAISAIARLKPAVNVVALVPATDNMPGGNAYKPGDVLRAMNGKTVEVLNTDAEGRLALADALSYAVSLKAGKIVDVATLTGACVIALGEICTGAMGNNRNLMNKVLTAAGKAGEKTWRLPMFPEYAEQIKSDIADIKNTGGRGAGSITAGKFLEEFVGKTPWVHLDIAGTAWSKVEHGDIIKGASGTPVRTLVNLALKLAE